MPEGIQDVERLSAATPNTTRDLRAQCSSPSGHEGTGVSGSLLLTWSNMADLTRISGSDPQLAELLEVNVAKHAAHATPTESLVAD